MKRKRPWWHRVLLYGGILLAGYSALCFYLADKYLHPDRRIPELPRGLSEMKLPDGTPAWLTPNLEAGKPSKVVFVFAHGYGGTRITWREAVEDLQAKGYDSIVPAMPGQDASPIDSVGFGPVEAKVLVEAANWARSKSATKVVLVGVSMGGAACWLASQLDPTVDAVVTEGAYARFDRAMLHWLDRLPGGSTLLRPVIWIASARSGIDPSKINPQGAARAWHGRPSLVIQGRADSVIESWHADRLSKAAGCSLWEVKGATHAQCYDVDRVQYAALLIAFAKAAAPPSSRPVPPNDTQARPLSPPEAK